METFAKIFDTPTTQVLVVLNYDPEGEAMRVDVSFSIEGARAQVGLIFPEEGDPACEEKANKAFLDFDQEQAERILASTKGALS